MKCIKVDSCDKCPYSHRVGHNLQTGKATYGCIELFGLPMHSIYDYNRELYNNTVYEGEIRNNCPLSDCND